MLKEPGRHNFPLPILVDEKVQKNSAAQQVLDMGSVGPFEVGTRHSHFFREYRFSMIDVAQRSAVEDIYIHTYILLKFLNQIEKKKELIMSGNHIINAFQVRTSVKSYI